MSTHKNRLILVLLVFLAASASPSRAAISHPVLPPSYTFFQPATYLGDDPNGYPAFYLSYFDTFTFDETSDQNYYIYKYGFGWLSYLGGTTTSSDDAYLYDFATDDVLYTSAADYP